MRGFKKLRVSFEALVDAQAFINVNAEDMARIINRVTGMRDSTDTYFNDALAGGLVVRWQDGVIDAYHASSSSGKISIWRKRDNVIWPSDSQQGEMSHGV